MLAATAASIRRLRRERSAVRNVHEMGSLFRYRELIRNLVSKDLKLKYRDSVLEFLWSLANPLLLILVYSFVFSHILRGAPQYFAYFLMIGILPWNFFAQSLSMATRSIVRNGGLIRKIALPLEVFPVATVLFNLAQFLLALAVFFPLAIFFKVPVAWSWFLFLLILALQIFFMLGLCLMVSTATVFYRDMRHFAETLGQACEIRLRSGDQARSRCAACR